MILRRGSRGDPVKRLQLRLTAVGFPPGAIDGDYGPKTEAAVRAWETAIHVSGTVDDAEFAALMTVGAETQRHSRCLDALLQHRQMPLPPAPRAGALEKHYGEPWQEPLAFERQWIAATLLPEPFRALTRNGCIRCHVDVALPLVAALLAVADTGAGDALQTFDGCFNIRAMRGYEGSRIKMYSVHSWGYAVDFNAALNPLGAAPTMDDRVVSAFKACGWAWGGEFLRRDGMHFEYTTR